MFEKAPVVKILSWIPSYGELTYYIGDSLYKAIGLSPFHKNKVDNMLRHNANGQAINYLKHFEVEPIATKKALNGGLGCLDKEVPLKRRTNQITTNMMLKENDEEEKKQSTVSWEMRNYPQEERPIISMIRKIANKITSDTIKGEREISPCMVKTKFKKKERGNASRCMQYLNPRN